jgi:glycosyltransferase involved in cell wall biosynthesis
MPGLKMIYAKTLLPDKIAHSLGYVPAAFKLIGQKTPARYDVVLCQYHPFHFAPLLSLLFSKARSVPLVMRADDMLIDKMLLSPHEYLYERLVQVMDSWPVFASDVMMVVSPELRRMLASVRKGRTVLVSPNGVDVSAFPEHEPCKELPATLELIGQRLLVFVGAVYPEDGLDNLLRAMPSLVSRIPGVTLLILGDGPALQSLKTLCSTLNLSDRVKFLGLVPRQTVFELIAASEICIGAMRPSILHRFTVPIKILEYMAAGKPVVGYPVSESIFKPGFNAIALNSCKPYEIADKLEMLLRDRKLGSDLGKRGRRLVKEVFSWDIIIQQLEGALASACSSS